MMLSFLICSGLTRSPNFEEQFSTFGLSNPFSPDYFLDKSSLGTTLFSMSLSPTIKVTLVENKKGKHKFYKH